MKTSWRITPFFFLNTIQFLDALNENLFKLIVTFFLIFSLGLERASSIAATVGAVFVLPFILFSSLGGAFADRWSKTATIRWTRIVQLAVLGFAWVSIDLLAPNVMYIPLFCLATLSAIFGPCKYGIIPEVAIEKKLLFANSMVAAFTYFGIILGTAFASVLNTFIQDLFPLMVAVCLLVGLIGTYLSFLLPRYPAANPKKKIEVFIYRELYDTLQQMREIPLMLCATFAYSYFLFIGGFVQMNIIPYSVEILGLSPVAGGYLFVFSVVGVGLGSLYVSKTSGHLSILAKAGLGLSVGCFLFTLFVSSFWICIISLVVLGFFGGIFLVPSQAFILQKSPLEHRGRNFATANFFSFVAALLAAGVLYLLNTVIGLNPLESFAVVGGVNLIVSMGLYCVTRKYPPSRST